MGNVNDDINAKGKGTVCAGIINCGFDDFIIWYICESEVIPK